MRLIPFLPAVILLGLLLIQSANSQVAVNQPLSQGFFGLEKQAGPTTYSITLPENASYLFAGILVKEGSADLSLQNSSGNTYPVSGGSAIVENALPGIYTLTVTDSGKYTVFWDYVAVERPAGCADAGGVCRQGGCGSYNNCVPSSGQCDSGSCCSGTCTTIIPPDATRITLGANNWFSFAQGQTAHYYFSLVDGPGVRITALPVDVFSAADFTLTLPDGRSWNDNGFYPKETVFQLCSQSFPPWSCPPNIPDQHMPAGDYLITVSATANGRWVIS